MMWLEGFVTPQVRTLKILPAVKLHVCIEGLLQFKPFSVLCRAFTGTFIRFVIIVYWEVMSRKKLIWKMFLACKIFKHLLVLIMHHHMHCKTTQGLLCFTTPFFQRHILTLTTMFLDQMFIIISPFSNPFLLGEQMGLCLFPLIRSLYFFSSKTKTVSNEVYNINNE